MQKPIAIVAAMQEEIAALLEFLPEHQAVRQFNTQFYRATHNDREIVVARCGVGKANAAATSALLIAGFAPQCVINIGCAGGLCASQRVLDLVVPEAVVYSDVDVTPLGFAYGQILGSEPRFYPSGHLLKLFKRLVQGQPSVPRCHYGLLGSADSFIYKQEQLAALDQNFQGEVVCVDMEGGAIAHVCTNFDVPFLILRALSDTPGQGDNSREFQQLLACASTTSAKLCLALVEQLSHTPLA